MEDAIKRNNSGVYSSDTDSVCDGNSVGDVGVKEKNRRNANVNMQLMYIQNNVDQAVSTRALLDIGRRPRWGTNVEIDELTKREKTIVPSKSTEMELRPFIYRSGSNKNNLKKTIGGLDKKTADYLWKVINHKSEKKPVIKINHSEDISGLSRKSSTVNVVSSNNSSPRLSRKGSKTSSSGSLLEKSNSMKFTSSGNVLDKSSTKKVLLMSNASEDLLDHDLELIDEGECTGLPVVNGIEQSLLKYKSLFSIDKGNKREKARKTINNISSKLAPDIYISELLEVDFSHRKINVGEREHLLAGRSHEEVNEFDEAMACYDRACLVNAKQPQTGNIYKGICLYHQGKYIAAINSFSLALKILERSLESNYNVDDHFVTVYNRGITYFRVGDDENGLIDFKKAVSLKPDHNGTREVFAMALRRVDRYNESIELIMQNKKVRLEKEYELEDIKNAKAIKHQLKIDARKKNSNNSDQLTRRSSQSFDESSFADDDASSIGQSIGHILIRSNNHRGLLHDKSQKGKTHGKSAEELGSSMEIVDAETICNGGLKSLVANKCLQLKNEGECDIGAKSFKAIRKSLGYNDDIFDSLFIKASSLQSALATAPGIRTKEHIETIVISLRLMPFLRNVSQSGMEGIASVIG
jgi:tetratricopeptide (TPR) repeat protein